MKTRQIGTYTTALCAKMNNKPLYVLVESYKFSRIYPLNQKEIPLTLKYKNPDLTPADEDRWADVDFTEPSYVTLLLTDLGPLDTAAVSDVLMQLYL